MDVAEFIGEQSTEARLSDEQEDSDVSQQPVAGDTTEAPLDVQLPTGRKKYTTTNLRPIGTDGRLNLPFRAGYTYRTAVSSKTQGGGHSGKSSDMYFPRSKFFRRLNAEEKYEPHHKSRNAEGELDILDPNFVWKEDVVHTVRGLYYEKTVDEIDQALTWNKKGKIRALDRNLYSNQKSYDYEDLVMNSMNNSETLVDQPTQLASIHDMDHGDVYGQLQGTLPKERTALEDEADKARFIERLAYWLDNEDSIRRDDKKLKQRVGGGLGDLAQRIMNKKYTSASAVGGHAFVKKKRCRAGEHIDSRLDLLQTCCTFELWLRTFKCERCMWRIAATSEKKRHMHIKDVDDMDISYLCTRHKQDLAEIRSSFKLSSKQEDHSWLYHDYRQPNACDATDTTDKHMLLSNHVKQYTFDFDSNKSIYDPNDMRDKGVREVNDIGLGLSLKWKEDYTLMTRSVKVTDEKMRQVPVPVRHMARDLVGGILRGEDSIILLHMQKQKPKDKDNGNDEKEDDDSNENREEETHHNSSSFDASEKVSKPNNKKRSLTAEVERVLADIASRGYSATDLEVLKVQVLERLLGRELEKVCNAFVGLIHSYMCRFTAIDINTIMLQCQSVINQDKRDRKRAKRMEDRRQQQLDGGDIQLSDEDAINDSDDGDMDEKGTSVSKDEKAAVMAVQRKKLQETLNEILIAHQVKNENGDKESTTNDFARYSWRHILACIQDHMKELVVLNRVSLEIDKDTKLRMPPDVTNRIRSRFINAFVPLRSTYKIERKKRKKRGARRKPKALPPKVERGYGPVSNIHSRLVVRQEEHEAVKK